MDVSYKGDIQNVDSRNMIGNHFFFLYTWIIAHKLFYGVGTTVLFLELERHCILYGDCNILHFLFYC